MCDESFEVVIRQAVPEDARAMQHFYQRLNETVPYLTIDYLEDEGQQADLIGQYLQADHHLMLVVEVVDEIVGMANLASLVTNYAEIGLALLPNFQHLGLGQNLIDALIDFGTRIDLDGLELTVDINNSGAIRFYLRNGFKIQAKTTPTTNLMTYRFE